MYWIFLLLMCLLKLHWKKQNFNSSASPQVLGTKSLGKVLREIEEGIGHKLTTTPNKTFKKYQVIISHYQTLVKVMFLFRVDRAKRWSSVKINLVLSLGYWGHKGAMKFIEWHERLTMVYVTIKGCLVSVCPRRQSQMLVITVLK